MLGFAENHGIAKDLGNYLENPPRGFVIALCFNGFDDSKNILRFQSGDVFFTEGGENVGSGDRVSCPDVWQIAPQDAFYAIRERCFQSCLVQP